MESIQITPMDSQNIEFWRNSKFFNFWRNSPNSMSINAFDSRWPYLLFADGHEGRKWRRWALIRNFGGLEAFSYQSYSRIEEKWKNTESGATTPNDMESIQIAPRDLQKLELIHFLNLGHISKNSIIRPRIESSRPATSSWRIQIHLNIGGRRKRR